MLPSLLVFFMVSTDCTLLHKFRIPLLTLEKAVWDTNAGLEPRSFTSHTLFNLPDALRPVIPDNAWDLLYYRGCWHIVCCPSIPQVPSLSSPKGVYNNKGFILHAVSLHQAFVHCGRFLTAATRRCMDRVSVPSRLVVLSDQLPVIALVGYYPPTSW